MNDPDGVLLPHGGYEHLRSYKVTEAVYDATVVFCDRFIGKRLRTHDQMVQAAHSGVRNISEGSGAAATSRKTEIKLTNVARASLSDELAKDYKSFPIQRGLRVWNKDAPEALAMRERLKHDVAPDLPPAPEKTVRLTGLAGLSDFIARAVPELAANAMLCAVNQAAFLIFWILVFSGQLLAAAARPGVDVAAVDRGRILQAANAALAMAPVTITQFRAKLSTGGPNDFYSNGDYWWPDPDKPDGLPYIQRDGQTNPENFNRHRLAIRQLRDGVAALGAAYQLTREQRYAHQAAYLLQVFFLDPATRMNPHLRYAQAVPGRTPGRGVGIIDTLHLIEVPVAIGALRESNVMRPEMLAAMKQWFGDYLEWMITSKNGQEEAAAKNNHAVAFWLQAAVFARFTGDGPCLAEARRQFKDVFVPDQMAADGSFPAELKRTKPYAYSIFQLDNMVTLCQVLSTPTENLWTFETPGGRGIRKAMAYLYPFLADKSKWPLTPDVQAWDAWPARPPGLLFAGLALGEKPWLELWQKLPPDPVDPEVQRNTAITQPLLWLK